MEKVQEKEQICPACGCHIGTDAYEKENVFYCCHACAMGGQCECGCCEVRELPTMPEG